MRANGGGAFHAGPCRQLARCHPPAAPPRKRRWVAHVAAAPPRHAGAVRTRAGPTRRPALSSVVQAVGGVFALPGDRRAGHLGGGAGFCGGRLGSASPRSAKKEPYGLTWSASIASKHWCFFWGLSPSCPLIAHLNSTFVSKLFRPLSRLLTTEIFVFSSSR